MYHIFKGSEPSLPGRAGQMLAGQVIISHLDRPPLLPNTYKVQISFSHWTDENWKSGKSRENGIPDN